MNKFISGELTESLQRAEMLPPDSILILETIPNFSGLAPQAQENNTSIVGMSAGDIYYSGVVKDNMLSRLQDFKKMYKKLAEKVSGLADATHY